MRRINKEISEMYYELLDSGYEQQFFNSHLEARKKILPATVSRLRGKSLCVGWSQTLRFTPPAPDIFIVADLSANSLKQAPDRPNLSKIQSDCHNLPFDNGTFDTVLLPNIIHHLAEDNLAETDLSVRNALKEASRVTRFDGHLIIIEPLLHPFLEVGFRIGFAVMRAYMNHRGLPMPCLYSLHNLDELLYDAKLITVSKEIPLAEEEISLSWFFHDKKIKAKFMPQQIHIITVKKRC